MGKCARGSDTPPLQEKLQRFGVWKIVKPQILFPDWKWYQVSKRRLACVMQRTWAAPVHGKLRASGLAPSRKHGSAFSSSSCVTGKAIVPLSCPSSPLSAQALGFCPVNSNPQRQVLVWESVTWLWSVVHWWSAKDHLVERTQDSKRGPSCGLLLGCAMQEHRPLIYNQRLFTYNLNSYRGF